MPYEEFQQACCNKDGDQYEKVGMTQVTSSIRHRAILGLVGGNEYQSVLDLGAGYGNMWMNDYGCRNTIRDLILTDSDPAACDHLIANQLELTRSSSMALANVAVGHCDHLTALERYGDHVECVVSCGALNYHDLSYLDNVLKRIEWMPKLDAILEINLQSPQGVTAEGAWQPSIASLYDLMYAHFLHDGKSSVSIHICKKFTAVVHIQRNGTANLAAAPTAFLPREED